MSTLIWAAFGFLAVVLVVGAAAVLALGLRAWRDVRRAAGALLDALAGLLERAEEAKRRVARAAGRTEELLDAAVRLRTSIARAQALLAAAQEVRDLVGGVRAYVPRK